jgi:hypothetical protein
MPPTPEFQALIDQVSRNTDAEASAVTVLNDLATRLAASANDPAAVTALATKLKASADTLAAAIVNDTPAASP